MEDLTLELKEFLEAKGFAHIIAVNISDDKRSIKLYYDGDNLFDLEEE